LDSVLSIAIIIFDHWKAIAPYPVVWGALSGLLTLQPLDFRPQALRPGLG
jgi:hypothetical protein